MFVKAPSGDSVNEKETIAMLDAEAMTAHQWIEAIVANHPNPGAVITSFQKGIENLVRHAPADIEPEQLVELRAHAAQQVLAVQKRIGKQVR